jgi:IclR family KDG regulon transcriptional repressor
LSRRLNFHKNKVFRLLATLESRDYVEQNLATGCYRLGLKSLHLAQTFVDQMGLLRQATVVQEALVRECNETSCVAILKGTQTVCLNAIESDLPVRVALSAGQRRPIHCTAAGKVLVSGLAKENVLEYIHSVELKRYTKIRSVTGMNL